MSTRIYDEIEYLKTVDMEKLENLLNPTAKNNLAEDRAIFRLLFNGCLISECATLLGVSDAAIRNTVDKYASYSFMIHDMGGDDEFYQFPTRAIRPLKRAGIKSLNELREMQFHEIAAIRLIGTVTATQICNVLNKEIAIPATINKNRLYELLKKSLRWIDDNTSDKQKAFDEIGISAEEIKTVEMGE